MSQARVRAEQVVDVRIFLPITVIRSSSNYSTIWKWGRAFKF